MIGAVLAICLLASEPGAAPAPASPAAGDSVLGFADDLLVHGDPSRAIDEYTRFLFLCGGCSRAPYAELRLAEAHRRAGAPAVAAARERALAAKWPDAPEGREAARAAGEDFERAGDFASASDAFREFAISRRADPDAADQAKLAIRMALRAHDARRVDLAIPLVLASAPAGTGTPISGLTADVKRTRARHRSPAIAGILAALLPGSGHAYAGEWANAFAAFSTNALFLAGAGIAADRKEWAVAGTAGAVEVFWYGGNVVGAVNAADRFNGRAEDARWRGLERTWFPSASISFEF